MKLKGIELIGKCTVNFENDYFEVFDERNNRIYYETDKGDKGYKKYLIKAETYLTENKGNLTFNISKGMRRKLISHILN